MKTDAISTLPKFTALVEAEAREVESAYCADLLSWAMGRAPAGCAWCTVMGNVNAIAVASLADVAAIILCENAVLDKDAQEKAAQQEIPVFGTELPAFEAALALSRAAGLYGL